MKKIKDLFKNKKVVIAVISAISVIAVTAIVLLIVANHKDKSIDENNSKQLTSNSEKNKTEETTGIVDVGAFLSKVDDSSTAASSSEESSQDSSEGDSEDSTDEDGNSTSSNSTSTTGGSSKNSNSSSSGSGSASSGSGSSGSGSASSGSGSSGSGSVSSGSGSSGSGSASSGSGSSGSGSASSGSGSSGSGSASSGSTTTDWCVYYYGSVSAYEQALFNDINRIRREKGYSDAVWDSTLASQAKQTSQKCSDDQMVYHPYTNMNRDYESVGETWGDSIDYISAMSEGLTIYHCEQLITECNSLGVGVVQDSDGDIYITIQGLK